MKAPKQGQEIIIGLGSRLTQRDFGFNKYNEGDRATIPSRVQFHMSDTSSSFGNIDFNNNQLGSKSVHFLSKEIKINEVCFNCYVA